MWFMLRFYPKDIAHTCEVSKPIDGILNPLFKGIDLHKFGIIWSLSITNKN